MVFNWAPSPNRTGGRRPHVSQPDDYRTTTDGETAVTCCRSAFSLRFSSGCALASGNFVEGAPLGFHSNVGVAREHGPRDVPGDVHGGLVTAAPPSGLGDLVRLRRVGGQRWCSAALLGSRPVAVVVLQTWPERVGPKDVSGLSSVPVTATGHCPVPVPP
jgi:hypothetical protein